MTREDKAKVIDDLTGRLTENSVLYLADISGLNAADTSKLRRICYKENVTLSVVKNTLLAKAMERSDKDFGALSEILKGNTSLMISEKSNAPARIIKDFRKKASKPELKGAYIEEAIYVGDEHLDTLVRIKSKEELVADVIALLQSPAKNVISALQSSGEKLSGILKKLSEKEA